MDTPTINPANHSELTSSENTWDSQWNECLQANMSINEFLQDKLNKKHDWGARYHSWLKQHGLQAETDNGWWSQSAVNMDNIQTFIDCVNGEPIGAECDALSDTVASVRVLGLTTQTQEGASILDLIAKARGETNG